jgi:predicted Zn-dependent protease
MNLSRYLSIVLAAIVFIGCGPGIRFRPGEIPAPTSTAPEHLEEAHQLHQQIIREMPVLRDPQAVRRVSRILDRILDVTPTTGHWTVTLIDNPAFNAMTTPGNFVYVFKGMLDQVRSDDEVAAVLAHEIGHRLAQHELKTTEQALGEAIAMIATVAAGVAVASQQGSTRRDVADVMNMTRSLGAGFTTLRYEKDQEREADQIGMFLIADAGINPMAAADVWAGRLSAEGGGGSDFFSTHPLHEDRYAMALQLLPVAHVRYEAALKRKKHGRSVTRKALSSPALYSHLAQAQEAIANDDLVTASTIAHSLVSRQPSSPEVHNLLGSVRLLQGDLGQAQKAFQRGLKLAPKDPTLLYNLACMHVRKGEHAAALRSLESAFMQNPALVDTAQSDSDLESLHDDENFKDLISRQYSVPAPQNVGGNTYSIN